MAGQNSNVSMLRLQQVADMDTRIKGNPELMLGRGQLQPFNASNSGARKLLASSQDDQKVPILYPELPIVATGRENRYGDLSSSIIQANGDYRVLRIIDKYSFAPKFHFFVVFHDMTNNVYKIQECRTDCHITEKHGVHYNTSFMKGLNEGDVIPKGTILRKSTSYDEYGNRVDGANLRTAYIATERNTEDSMLISETAAKIMSTTHFMHTDKLFNSNSRLLNLYGDDNNYKGFPDIGEHTVNNIFCCIATASKEEELYVYTKARSKIPMMSDDCIKMSGKVVDINVYCNDPERLNTYYNGQLKKYYDESIRYYTEILEIYNEILANDPYANIDYHFKEMKDDAEKLLSGASYMTDGRIPNFVKIEITLEENAPIKPGDKMADRYGGKGVISAVIPDMYMPMDDMGNRIHIIVNSSTCVNRENPGQLFELCSTYISERIVKYISDLKLSATEAMELELKFFKIISPQQYEYTKAFVDNANIDQLEAYVYSLIQDQFIYMSLRPITDNMTEDKLEMLYDAFPFIDQTYLMVPLTDSNGNIRFVRSRRKAIAGMKYMYRLKQFAEDKFSATSLSATNLQNLNAKSKAFKRYKTDNSNTPIAMGTMESDNLSSVGMEFVIHNLMINSVSPNGRRLMKQALVGDPFTLNIELDDDCYNRNVEKLNAYQMAKGVALIFKKVKKKVVNLVERFQCTYPVQWVKRMGDPNLQYDIDLTKKIYENANNNKEIVSQMWVREMTDDEQEEALKKLKEQEKEV